MMLLAVIAVVSMLVVGGALWWMLTRTTGGNEVLDDLIGWAIEALRRAQRERPEAYGACRGGLGGVRCERVVAAALPDLNDDDPFAWVTEPPPTEMPPVVTKDDEAVELGDDVLIDEDDEHDVISGVMLRSGAHDTRPQPIQGRRSAPGVPVAAEAYAEAPPLPGDGPEDTQPELRDTLPRIVPGIFDDEDTVRRESDEWPTDAGADADQTKPRRAVG